MLQTTALTDQLKLLFKNETDQLKLDYPSYFKVKVGVYRQSNYTVMYKTAVYNHIGQNKSEQDK